MVLKIVLFLLIYLSYSAIEERDLQKMAAIGEKDSQNDELLQMLDSLKQEKGQLEQRLKDR